MSNNGVLKINNNNNLEKEQQQQNAYDNAELKEKGNDLEFENCNVYLKNINPINNRPNSRKRSAFKYIEDNLEKDKRKSTSNNDPTSNLINNINLNDNSNGNYNSFNSKHNAENDVIINTNNHVNIEHKPKIMQSDNISQNLFNDKKPEYESRRKKQMNFLNCIDNITNDKAKGSNNNLIDNQIQKNFQKFNDNILINSNNNNITSGTYESRRGQVNYSKSTIMKDKEGDNLNRNKNFFNK